MPSRQFYILATLIIFLLCGCSTHRPTLRQPPVNLDEIHQNIVKKDKKSAVLEADQDTGEQEQRPKVTEFVPSAEDEITPALQIDQAAKKGRKIPAETDATEETDGILLNFDNADIFEVIQVIAETLNLNYIIDPQVKGVVNIRSGKKIPKNQLFALFNKILHINGLDIRSEGNYDYIYVAKKAATSAISGPEKISSLKDSSDLILQILPIVHLPAAEITKLVEPYLSAQGSIFDMPAQNTLLINDYESKVIDILRIVSRLDISPLSSLHVKLVRIDNAPLFDLKDELVEIFTALKINRKEYEGISVIPLERVNSLMLISSNRHQLENGVKWVKDLDLVPSLDRDNIYIYNVRNSVASELAELINQLLSEDNPKSKTTSTQQSDTTDSKTAKTVQKKGSEKALSSLRFIGEPVVFADDVRNVILIRALPTDYSRIVKLLERLDNMPRQVLVEVIVAEVSLTDNLALGVEWALHNNDLKMNGSNYLQNFSTSGNIIPTTDFSPSFSYQVFSPGIDTPRLLLQTLASESNISILSSPQILVLNNETATVNVGEQVPIVTSETQNATDSTDYVDKTVQYKDTGVILEVTPQINYDGVILLDIKQTVSEVGKIPEQGVQSYPISNRELKTKLAVKDGQSIMIGGLISKKETTGETGIPLLKDIPVLGYLFKYESLDVDKTELLIMVTPYVIETEDVLDQYVREFDQKMSAFRKELYERNDANQQQTTEQE